MLETVDFKAEKLSKEIYKPKHDELIKKLVVLQQQAHNEGIGLVVLFEGWNGAGKGSRISDLMYNLDARSTSVYVQEDFDRAKHEDFAGREHGVTDYYPLLQDFWKALGARGTITFFDRGWYADTLQHMLYNAPAKLLLPKGEERHYLDSIHDFEKQLVADGYVVVKFFVHVTKKGQIERLERLHDDPVTRWRVSESKLKSAHNYATAYELYDRLLERSNFDFAPWVLLNGEDKRRTNLTIAETLVAAIEGALQEKALADQSPEVQAAQAKVAAEAAASDKIETAPAESASGAEAEASAAETAETQVSAQVPETESSEAAPEERGVLSGAKLAAAVAQAELESSFAPTKSRFKIVKKYPRIDDVDHSLVLPENEYKKQLKELQAKLFRLENIMYQDRIPLMIMYEGWDAAGKGGNIKRVAQALDARAYNIYPSPAPTKPELMHPFLWRYWTRLPKAGHVGMYDRSWYGRVLVERVEGFATTEEWSRAYDEINEFEHDLIDWGAILLKFWVDVSPEEQLRRFQERESNPDKQWKITEDDWRNRDKYPQYKAAIDDMFRLTSTEFAPWIVLESDDKRYARVKALKIIVKALEKRLMVKE